MEALRQRHAPDRRWTQAQKLSEGDAKSNLGSASPPTIQRTLSRLKAMQKFLLLLLKFLLSQDA